VIPPHPAKFSDSILDVLRRYLPIDVPTLDPMAGVGRIFEVAPWAVGLEIEPEWAAADPRIVCGDALTPPWPPGTFRVIVTSCTYGNRMADHHDAQEKCRACAGEGRHRHRTAVDDYEEEVCSKCEGLGRRSYTRLTYRHRLGRELHPHNSGGMAWGPGYREFHEQAWAALLPLLDDDPQARFILNVKDHWKTLRKGEAPVLQEVTAWHVETIAGLGWVPQTFEWVETPGMRFGQNRDTREAGEWVLVFARKESHNRG
jgi:hypothetical protein